MKKSFTLITISTLLITILSTSCKKIPGYSLVPTTSSGGSTGGSTSGATFGTTTGTITFKIGNGTVNTWTSTGSNYILGFGTTPTTGPYAPPVPLSTLVTGIPSDPNQAITNLFSISFNGTATGTFPMNIVSSIVTPTTSLTAAGGSEMITVTEANIKITSTDYGTVKGNTKGTFDGQMLDMNTGIAVHVSGTFNVQL